ncbi:hypothetical protein [Nonomuraea indica]|uniref:DUF732 domain-containing protein n=1 Tax=Nonomuraea indica TaxID=1581193 RepID=A0ABW8A0A2_9ACTN
MPPRPSRAVTAEAGPPPRQPADPQAWQPADPQAGSPRRRRLTVALLTAGITVAATAAVAAELMAGGVSGGRADVPGGLLASSGGTVAGSLARADAEAEPREPTPGQRARFLARIGAIAPWLASEEDRTLTRARATCDDIRRGDQGDQLVSGDQDDQDDRLVSGDQEDRLVSDAQERFTDVTAGQAAAIVEAVRSWCAP